MTADAHSQVAELGAQLAHELGRQSAEKNGAQPAPNSAGPRGSERLRDRLDRWKPQLRPIVVAFFITLVVVGWITVPYSGPLGWPLTILWTWPIINTLISLRGIMRTRRILRASRRNPRGEGLPVCEDFLIVVVPTIGRHDTYPALERSVLSFVRHLPSCFPRTRVDIITEDACEAQDKIAWLSGRSPLIRLTPSG